MKLFMMLILVACAFVLKAQGPPITVDKPIMLGGKSFTIKSLTEVRTTDRGTSAYIPVMVHYLPTANTLLAVHIPIINYSLKDIGRGTDLADLKILGKYQFYRKDQTGKTYRLVAKTFQNLPTGRDLNVIDQSTGEYQGYYGIVSGYETLKYGISTEIGYNWSPSVFSEFRAKLGFGLPLLKPQYPNKQVNLFFEYSSNLFTDVEQYQLLFAQGVQYALKNITFDLAVQLPLISNNNKLNEFKNSVYVGTRYTF